MALFTGFNIGEDRRMEEEGRWTGGNVSASWGRGDCRAMQGSVPVILITPLHRFKWLYNTTVNHSLITLWNKARPGMSLSVYVFFLKVKKGFISCCYSWSCWNQYFTVCHVVTWHINQVYLFLVAVWEGALKGGIFFQLPAIANIGKSPSFCWVCCGRIDFQALTQMSCLLKSPRPLCSTSTLVYKNTYYSSLCLKCTLY